MHVTMLCVWSLFTPASPLARPFALGVAISAAFTGARSVDHGVFPHAPQCARAVRPDEPLALSISHTCVALLLVNHTHTHHQIAACCHRSLSSAYLLERVCNVLKSVHRVCSEAQVLLLLPCLLLVLDDRLDAVDVRQ